MKSLLLYYTGLNRGKKTIKNYSISLCVGSVLWNQYSNSLLVLSFEPLLSFNDLSAKHLSVDGPFVSFPSCYCFTYVYIGWSNKVHLLALETRTFSWHLTKSIDNYFSQAKLRIWRYFLGTVLRFSSHSVWINMTKINICRLKIDTDLQQRKKEIGE